MVSLVMGTEGALPEIVTIGVYGWDATRFFQALLDARVDTLCDIRDRRGVRGSEYSFANRERLQGRLEQLGIHYIHRRDLAPSREVRELQYRADRTEHVAKRQRVDLTPDFVQAYRRERLAQLSSAAFITQLGPEARVIALFCVERDAAACHRSLVAVWLAHDLGVKVTHITP